MLARAVQIVRANSDLPVMEALHGYRATRLRTEVAACLLGRKVTALDREADYQRLRQRLLRVAGIPATGTAAEQDAKFEEVVSCLSTASS